MGRLETAGVTHAGNVRKKNEDAFVIHEVPGVAIVADGVGGAACGDLAAQLTVTAIGDFILAAEGADLETSVLQAVQAADERVRRVASENSRCMGMKSTVVFARWAGARLWIANVGDSRAYRLREGVLTQISHDHTLSAEFEETVGWGSEPASHYALGRGLTMSIGGARHPVPRLHNEVFEGGDVFLLCTDGLYGPVSEPALTEILTASADVSSITEQLLGAALRAGAPDNVTAVVLRYREPE